MRFHYIWSPALVIANLRTNQIEVTSSKESLLLSNYELPCELILHLGQKQSKRALVFRDISLLFDGYCHFTFAIIVQTLSLVLKDDV